MSLQPYICATSRAGFDTPFEAVVGIWLADAWPTQPGGSASPLPYSVLARFCYFLLYPQVNIYQKRPPAFVIEYQSQSAMARL